MLETFGDIESLSRPSTVALAECDLPVIAQLTFGDDGRTLRGEEPRAAAAALVGTQGGGDRRELHRRPGRPAGWSSRSSPRAARCRSASSPTPACPAGSAASCATRAIPSTSRRPPGSSSPAGQPWSADAAAPPRRTSGPSRVRCGCCRAGPPGSRRCAWPGAPGRSRRARRAGPRDSRLAAPGPLRRGGRSASPARTGRGPVRRPRGGACPAGADLLAITDQETSAAARSARSPPLPYCGNAPEPTSSSPWKQQAGAWQRSRPTCSAAYALGVQTVVCRSGTPWVAGDYPEPYVPRRHRFGPAYHRAGRPQRGRRLARRHRSRPDPVRDRRLGAYRGRRHGPGTGQSRGKGESRRALPGH